MWRQLQKLLQTDSHPKRQNTVMTWWYRCADNSRPMVNHIVCYRCRYPCIPGCSLQGQFQKLTVFPSVAWAMFDIVGTKVRSEPLSEIVALTTEFLSVWVAAILCSTITPRKNNHRAASIVVRAQNQPNSECQIWKRRASWMTATISSRHYLSVDIKGRLNKVPTVYSFVLSSS